MKGRILRFEGSVHAQADRLLPWLVNRTLTDDERRQVEHHLTECATCRREADWLRVVQDACQDDEPATPAAPHAMRRLRRRIAAESAATFTPPVSAWRRRGRRLAWLAAVQAVLVLGLGAALYQQRHAAYHTLGAVPAKTTLLVVVFDPQLSEARMRELLRAGDARIVDGPSAAGAYLLRVPDARADATRRMLHDSGMVSLVESLGADSQP